MRTGFDTIGNATLIVWDKGRSVLATDPWLDGPAYFGSWALSHEIPSEQMQGILSARYVWFSHGHPDHVNPDSLPRLKGQTILLPDHYGNRIRNDLQAQGFTVQVLVDRKWTRLSEHVQVFCFADYNQDAILLVDCNGRLVINLNDAVEHGWLPTIREESKRYPLKVLLALFGYGDADMINFFDGSGHPIPPYAAQKRPVGATIARAMRKWEADYCIPFSSLHHYQRSDSIWANEYVTRLEDYERGFSLERERLLPAFVRFDCETNQWEPIHPAENRVKVAPPEDFQDVWSDALTADDKKLLRDYFRSMSRLSETLDFVNLRVGGEDFTISLSDAKVNRGVTFETPRHSLVASAQYRIFDDLLIGNFMKTTLHGKWPVYRLYPDFSPYVAKYADNGGARTREELEAYFEHYRRKAPMDFLLHKVRSSSSMGVRQMLAPIRGTSLYRGTRSILRHINP